jgi:hypothetical protein
VRFARLSFLLTAFLASSALLGACGDDPLFPDVMISVDTVTVTVPGSTAPSAIDLVRTQPPFDLLRNPELIRDAGEWDITLRRGASGGLVFLPFDQPGSPLRGAGITRSNRGFDDLAEAPRGVAAYGEEPVAVTADAVFLLRSRQYPQSGTLCVNYAKVRVLAVDEAAGTAEVAIVVNDNCDDERLEDDD